MKEPLLNFTIEDAVEIQRQQLAEWEPKLVAEVYDALGKMGY